MASFSGSAPAAASGGGGGGDSAVAMIKFGTADDTYIVATMNSAAVSETAPESPATGDFWYDSANAELFMYYDNAWIGLV